MARLKRCPTIASHTTLTLGYAMARLGLTIELMPMGTQMNENFIQNQQKTPPWLHRVAEPVVGVVLVGNGRRWVDDGQPE